MSHPEQRPEEIGRKEELCPITVRAREKETGITIDLSLLAGMLPEYCKPEEILFDPLAITRICQLARIQVLTVAGIEKVESAVTSVQGVNEDVAAVGTGVVGAKNTVESTSYYSNIPEFVRGLQFSRETISLNLANVAGSIDEIRSPAEWARFLDKELKKELREIVGRKLGVDFKKLLIDLTIPILMPIGGVLNCARHENILVKLLGAGSVGFWGYLRNR